MDDKLSRSAVIAGVAESDLGKVPGKSSLELQAQAAPAALADAGLSLKDVDGVFAHTDDRFSSLQVAEHLGLTPRYVDSTNVGGMSNIVHIAHAMNAIASGACSVALITYGSTQLSDGSRKSGAVAADRPDTARGQFILPYGHLSPIGYYAMVAQLHAHRYGSTPKDLAEIAVAARRWAQLNPKAYRREPTSIEEVMASPLIADPLRQRDCCLVTDGGGAIVLTRADRARDLARPPVYVLGNATAIWNRQISCMPDLTTTAAAQSGAQAFAMAGLRAADMDMAQVYDAFTINTLLFLEDLGFCAKGEGGAFVQGGGIAPGGRLAVNTNGGGLSCVHPGMYGIFALIEAVRQLRGEAGARQLNQHRTAVVHGNGGTLSSQSTAVLGTAETL